jgi:hypothetical protein
LVIIIHLDDTCNSWGVAPNPIGKGQAPFPNPSY